MTQEAPGSPRNLRKRRESPPQEQQHSQKLQGAGDSEIDGESSSSEELDRRSAKKSSIVEKQKEKWLKELRKSEPRDEIPPPRPTTPRVRTDEKKQFKLEIILAIAGLIFIGSIWKFVIVDEGWMRGTAPRNNKSLVLISNDEAQKQLKETVKHLKNKYPSQSMHTWLQLFSAVSSTITKDMPRQPSSIVLLTPPDLDSGFTPCLSRELGRATHSIHRGLTGLQYTEKILRVGPGYFQSKKSVSEIHDELKTYLNNGKVVIVNDVQQVNDPERLMVFHAFCDNTAAPDKRATFIFIVPVPTRIYRKYPTWSHAYGAEIAQEILDEAWTSLSPDKRPALISRVAAYIAMINPGDRCTERND